jgi:transcription initiation factor IIE alpha subunit
MKSIKISNKSVKFSINDSANLIITIRKVKEKKKKWVHLIFLMESHGNDMFICEKTFKINKKLPKVFLEKQSTNYMLSLDKYRFRFNNLNEAEEKELRQFFEQAKFEIITNFLRQ